MAGAKILDRLAFIAEAFALVLTFLLPLKLGTMSGVPEMPMAYWNTPLALLLAAWPPTLLAPLAGILLALCVPLAPWTEIKSLPLRITAFHWSLLAVIALIGFLNASVWDFPMHAASHTFGIAAYAASLCILLEKRPRFARLLTIALLAGAALSFLSGFYQYFEGFEATRQFAYEQELKSGVGFLSDNFKTRLGETRISADFTLCNAYAGYLLIVIPLFLWAIHEFASRVEPVKIAKPLLLIPVAGATLFLFFGTGSRGALLAAGGAALLAAGLLPFGRKIRMAALIAFPLLLSAFIALVMLGRGFKSMAFRFDYYIAAFKMMVAHPFAGTGWGDFFHEYMKLKLLHDAEAPHTPHNFPLDFGSQTGVLGFAVSCALLLLPLAFGVFCSWKRAKAAGHFTFGLDEVLICGYAAWGIHSLTDINFETPGSVCIAIAAVSIMLSRLDIQAPKIPYARIIFDIMAVGTLIGALLYGRALLVSDIAYANLHSLTDFRFMSKEEIADVTPEKVRTALKTCVEVSPKSPFPWAATADYLLSTGHPDEAEGMLKEAIARSPERASFHYKLFQIYSRDPARTQDALAELKKSRELFPKNPEYEKTESDFNAFLARKALAPQ